MFRTQYDKPRRVFSCVGSPEKVLYQPCFDENGVMDLVEVGKEDLYGYIQSHKDSVDIHVILKRFEQGDVAALSRVQGTYGDFTEMPKTYAEALNAMIHAENYFNGLPVEVRAEFGHSFQQFLASMDKEDFVEKMHVTDSAPDPVPDPVSE